jgi:hypothetical protein
MNRSGLAFGSRIVSTINVMLVAGEDPLFVTSTKSSSISRSKSPKREILISISGLPENSSKREPIKRGMKVPACQIIATTTATAQQQQLQRSMITGSISPTAQQIIDSVHSECAKVTPSFLVEICLFRVYESDITIVLNSELLIVQTGGV